MSILNIDIQLQIDSENRLRTKIICYVWWTCFSKESRHTKGYTLCSSSRLVPLFVRERLHTGASREKRKYLINREIYTPYAGAVGMLLHIYGEFTMETLKSSLLSSKAVCSRPHFKDYLK
jgi:hypothetical protein